MTGPAAGGPFDPRVFPDMDPLLGRLAWLNDVLGGEDRARICDGGSGRNTGSSSSGNNNNNFGDGGDDDISAADVAIWAAIRANPGAWSLLVHPRGGPGGTGHHRFFPNVTRWYHRVATENPWLEGVVADLESHRR